MLRKTDGGAGESLLTFFRAAERVAETLRPLFFSFELVEELSVVGKLFKLAASSSLPSSSHR